VSRPQRPRIDREQLRITRGAAILLALEVGMTLVWLFLDKDIQARAAPWLIPTAETVLHQGHVWTLVTGAFLEPDFLSLLLQGAMLWLFVPALERWWGMPRFLRFAAYTSLIGTTVGTLAGLALGHPMVPIMGLDPFIWASVIAFGIIYARQPVQFFGVVPITGRQMMYGMLGFVTLFVLLQGAWEQGAAYAAALGLAALLTNQKWNPRLAWLRMKKRRERAHLSVLAGGKPGASSKSSKAKKKPEQWLN
jgi:membrane associated rhomboid family serine protease